MKLLTDEQLCEASLTELKSELERVVAMRRGAAYSNRWKRHQQLGEYLHKIDQLIKEHTSSDQ